MLLDVKVTFDKCLGEVLPETLKDREAIKRFLLQHERKDLVLRNLCREIMAAEHRMRAKFTKADLDEMCKSAARLFANAALQSWLDTHQSDAERVRRASEDSKYDEIRSCIKEVPDAEESNSCDDDRSREDSRSESARLV